MERMKDCAIVGNIGHFDNEIDMAGLKKVRKARVNIKPQYDAFVFPDGHRVLVLAEGRLLNLGLATGHPSFVMSNSLHQPGAGAGRAGDQPRGLREEGLHAAQAPRREGGGAALQQIGARLTKLTRKQAAYLGIPQTGPFKPDHYRYYGSRLPMNLLSAVLLGVVQALTEFLPVSSTAHLLVFGELLGHHLDDPPFRAFITIIQSGTTLAVLVYFRPRKWRASSAAGVRGLARGRPFETREARLGWYIVLGTLPAALAGFLLEHRIEALGNWVIACSLVLLGLVLLAAERYARHARGVEDVTARDALLVGIGQALALVPGSSRSGTTVTAGMLLGLARGGRALQLPPLGASSWAPAPTSS